MQYCLYPYISGLKFALLQPEAFTESKDTELIIKHNNLLLYYLEHP